MNVQKESQLGAHAIMWAVTNRRKSVEGLLIRNGITPLINYPLENLVTKALRTSKPFRADFLAFMAQNPNWVKSYMSVNPDFANASGSVADNSLNLDNLIGGNTPKKNWFTADNIEGTLNTALQGYLALDKNKTDRELARASRDVAMYKAGDKEDDDDDDNDTKSNTALYVVLGVVGVALVGGLIYFATKKS
jgi:hypothetical protein